MTWLRAKTPAEIRATALAMARKKIDEGCLPCIGAYLDLARQHGASEDDLAEVAELSTAP